MNVRIEVMNGPLDGQDFIITRSSDIGRDPSTPISLPFDKYLSRRHARILVAEPECFLEDLSSTNGTFIRGERLHGRILLKNGEIFTAGRTMLKIEW